MPRLKNWWACDISWGEILKGWQDGQFPAFLVSKFGAK